MRNKILLFCALMILAARSSRAGVSISQAQPGNACRVISLARWKAPTLPPNTIWTSLLLNAPLQSDLDFRTHDGGVLVGLIAFPPGYPKARPAVYSPDRYAIDFSTGKVKKATEEQWAHSDHYRAVRESPLRTGLLMRDSDKLTYKGKAFPKRTTKWPLNSQARLSSNHRLIAVNSWDGYMAGGGDWEILFGRPGKGNLYVDIYDINSGALVLSLGGHFSGTTNPDRLFSDSAWISDRYYILPLDDEHINKFALCDLDRASNTPRDGK